ncbi:MAG: YdeI/OmpD-associated family protein [Acidobacteria bacterium]|nr:YdeI/OmpD-associated family protein [Acidobacteriota bacterium]
MDRMKSIDQYIEETGDWRVTLQKIRRLALSTGMEETMKWGRPVYTHQKKNIVGMAAFKQHAGVWFFQGALLDDPEKRLVNAQEGKTQAMRQWRITDPNDVDEGTLLNYMKEAMRLQEKGRRVATKAKRQEVPPELLTALAESPELETAFKNLRPGQQREYSEYIETAKRAETKSNRIDRITPMIMAGVGLNDKYR